MTPAPLQLTLLGEPVRLAAPWALGLLAVAALVVGVGAWSLARRRAALREAFGPLGPRLAPGAGAARPGLRLGAQGLGLALLALALARPQCGTRAELGKRYGIDLAVALDVSRSMLARDERPDRLGRARLEVGALLDRLGGDRVAIVLFAADAFVQCPLTTDYAAARLLLRGASPAALPRQGTSLAAALTAAGEALSGPDRTGRSRAVVLLSDGEGHDAGPEAAAAADRLAADGIRVFAVGVGTAGGAPIPELDEQGRVEGHRRGADGRPIVTRLEEGALADVAARTGGRYFHAAGAVGLPELGAELDRLEKAEIEGRTTVTWEERYALLALPGFLLLLLGALLSERHRGGGEADEVPGPVDGAGSGTGSRPEAGAAPAPRLRSRPARGAAPDAAPLLLAALAFLSFGANPLQREHDRSREGRDALAAGEAARALGAYEALEREAGARPEVAIGKGVALHAAGRDAEARDAFAAARDAPEPLGSKALVGLATALAGQGDLPGAVAAAREALVRDPASEEARHDLEVLLRRKAQGGAPRPDEDRPRDPGGSGEQGSRASGGGAEERTRGGSKAGEREKQEGPGPSDRQDPSRPAPTPAGSGAAERKDEAEQGGGAAGGRLEREEAARLLDAMRARERNLPTQPAQPRAARSQDAEKDW